MIKKITIFRECAKLVSFAKPYWRYMLTAFFTMIIYTSMSGFQISLIKPIIDKLVKAETQQTPILPTFDLDQPVQKQQKNNSPVKQFQKHLLDKFQFIENFYRSATSSFLNIGIVMAILAPLIFLTCYLQKYLRERVMWAIVMDIRNKVCDHLLLQPLTFFENKKSGDLLSRLTNDINTTQTGLNVLFDEVLFQPLQLMCGLALSFYFSWKLALLTLIAFPLIFLPAVKMGKKIRKHGRKGFKHLADLTDALREMFSGIRIIKAFKMEAEESREIYEIGGQILKKRLKLTKAKAFNEGLNELFYALGLAALITFGGYVVVSGKITPGALIGFITATGFMINSSLKKLAKSYAILQESLAGVSRVFELLAMEPTIKDAPGSITIDTISKDIAFKNVSFAYDGSGEFVLKDINFTIHKGEVVAIIGRSGAGKTTLVNMIPRFYDPVKGSIEIDGIDLRQIKQDSLLVHIAMVTQQTFLFNRSIYENILYGRRDATTAEVHDAAKAANIHEFIMNLPNGYNTIVGEMGVKLSGGQRQRIAIARAILKNASILLLDEATSSLDYESEKLVQDALNRLIRGRTTIVVAHRLTTIQHCDKIIVMKNGHIVEIGNHESLMSQDSEYKRTCQLHLDMVQS